jgi:hypothetical protein
MSTLVTSSASSGVGLRQVFNYNKTHTFYYTNTSTSTFPTWIPDNSVNIDAYGFNPVTVAPGLASFVITNPEPAYPMVVTVTTNMGFTTSATTNQDVLTLYHTTRSFTAPGTLLGTLPGSQSAIVPSTSGTALSLWLSATTTFVLNSVMPSLAFGPSYAKTNTYSLIQASAGTTPIPYVIITISW